MPTFLIQQTKIKIDIKGRYTLNELPLIKGSSFNH